jgi:hypothetical protein
MTKKLYIQPSIDVANFQLGTIICASGSTPDLGYGGGGDPNTQIPD